ncbi:MAG: DUF6498-containing protein [Patescibacteria group bacterium]|nr:DUF6498-containing protein [Patescibacteria group bacterium]
MPIVENKSLGKFKWYSNENIFNNLIRLFKFSPSSFISILIINFIPLYGFIFLNWNFVLFLFYYWLETFFIGIFHFLKLTKIKIYNKNPDKFFIPIKPFEFFLIILDF